MIRPVPRISAFYGIVIAMYYRDHAPPHFHAVYGEYEATIVIATLSVLSGDLPATSTATRAGVGATPPGRARSELACRPRTRPTG